MRIGKSQPVYANGSQARFTWGLELRKDLKRVFSLGQYDIIHVHSPLSPVLPVMAIEEANCPVVGTFHTYFDRSFFYTVGNRYFQKRLDKLDAAIAVSHSTTIAVMISSRISLRRTMAAKRSALYRTICRTTDQKISPT